MKDRIPTISKADIFENHILGMIFGAFTAAVFSWSFPESPTYVTFIVLLLAYQNATIMNIGIDVWREAAKVKILVMNDGHEEDDEEEDGLGHA